jgi:hypothetical protein
MQVFLTKGMARFTRREQIGLTNLREAIARAESGLIDADLGGGSSSRGSPVQAKVGRAVIAPSSLTVAVEEQCSFMDLQRMSGKTKALRS